MVDLGKQIDLGGDDIAVGSVMFSAGPGQARVRVIDTAGATVVTIAGTSATLTLANIAAGLIISTNAGATTLTLDSAANLVSSLNTTYSGAQVGDTFVFDVSSHGAAGATVAVGTGGTFQSGSTGTVATGTQKTFYIQMTNVTTAPAYNVYA